MRSWSRLELGRELLAELGHLGRHDGLAVGLVRGLLEITLVVILGAVEGREGRAGARRRFRGTRRSGRQEWRLRSKFFPAYVRLFPPRCAIPRRVSLSR